MRMDWYSLADFFNILSRYAYLGAFMISLLGSLIPFLPLPYLIPIVLMADKFNPVILGVAAGLGGAVGKITSYLIGRVSRRFFSLKNSRESFITRAIDKYGVLAVFLFALTPLPDDVLYIPAGFARMNFMKFMVANALGKIVLTIIIALLGRAYFTLVRLYIGSEASIYPVIGSIIFMIILSIILFKIDWETVIENYKKHGLIKTIKILLSPPKSNSRNKHL
ncbi:MAG: VTT domain-containing protein [Thaumarchaeota archaeon]|jgi:membrane protein YqaA with SNARE-associated domain|nr:VTT domain-containing protein [Candidatus Geocrenenecus arthurdayi]MCL7403274.1 VTT domain-containing protein [Candidatus Geocrenenecus arthurdayi]